LQIVSLFFAGRFEKSKSPLGRLVDVEEDVVVEVVVLDVLVVVVDVVVVEVVLLVVDVVVV